MKRTLTITLALLLLLSACGSADPAEENDTAAIGAAETETLPAETEYAPDLPDVTYDGAELRVLYRDGTHAYNTLDVFTDALNGEVVNDAVYNRNINMETQYDFKFLQIPSDTAINDIKADYMAATGDYDLAFEQMNALFPLVLEEYFCDWNDLSHFNPADPWWDSNCAEDLSVAGQLYIMAGDISMQPSNGARFIYYNKGLMEDFGFGDPYAIVREGKWTIDRMTEMVAGVSVDLNGDGEFTADDTLGLLTENPDFFLSGCGVLYTGKDENDLPTVTCVNERTLTAMEAVKTLMTVPNATTSYNDAAAGRDISGYPHLWQYVRAEFFATGHFLFLQNGCSEASTFIDMDPGYGVLPNPKLDEAQEDYYHLSDPFNCAWVIPVGTPNKDMVDVLLTAWAYNSSDLVEAYYEKTLKFKRFNAPDDAEMLDIIRASVRYELSMLCNLGVSDVIINSYNTGNFMSNYAKRETQIATNIEKYFGKFVQ